MPNTPKPAARSAITLIEIMVVIAIIVILAGLLLSIWGYVQDKAARELARNQIAQLTSDLLAYRADNGTLPIALNGASDTSSAALIIALYPANAADGRIYDSNLIKMMNSYRPGADPQAIRRAATHLVDPYGNPWHYQFNGTPGRGGPNTFDLWSQGKENSPDTNKWIKNW